MAQSQPWQCIPTILTLEQFEEFVLPHLHSGSRGPHPKLPLHTIFINAAMIETTFFQAA